MTNPHKTKSDRLHTNALLGGLLGIGLVIWGAWSEQGLIYSVGYGLMFLALIMDRFVAPLWWHIGELEQQIADLQRDPNKKESA